MTYFLYILINLIFTFFFFYLNKKYGFTKVTLRTYGKLFANIGIIFFIFNLSMYVIFTIIKKTKNRDVKIFFAKLSRKVFKFHIPSAIFGTNLILLHAISMINNITGWTAGLHPKVIFGYLSILFLIATLTSGYIRRRKANKLRRKFHLYTAMAFALVFIIHIQMPW